MSVTLTRRTAFAVAAALLPLVSPLAAVPSAAQPLRAAAAQLAAIEQRWGGRLGVLMLNTGTGACVAQRPDERFPMCSTFKLLAVAAVLKRVDAGRESLARKIPFGVADLTTYAPIAKAHVSEGSMDLASLCAAALQWSDNTAANLILRTIGGPAAVTRYARSLGDRVTRLDRNEPALNLSKPGDPRDTTSPRAMLRDMQAILLGQVLSPASRQQLVVWLIGDQVGGKRLRAGAPSTWRVGDKTGTGDNGTANTVAILWPPDRAPILATVYYTGSSAPPETLNAVHAEIGGILARTL